MIFITLIFTYIISYGAFYSAGSPIDVLGQSGNTTYHVADHPMLNRGNTSSITFSESLGEYIVLLEPDDPLVKSKQHHFRLHEHIRKVGSSSRIKDMFPGPLINGYCGEFDQATLSFLNTCQEVISIEENKTVTLPDDSSSDKHFLQARSLSNLPLSGEETLCAKTSRLNELEAFFTNSTDSSDYGLSTDTKYSVDEIPSVDPKDQSFSENSLLEAKSFDVAVARFRHGKIEKQKNPPWNLERIAMKPRALDKFQARYHGEGNPVIYPFGNWYSYPKHGGKNVTVYVVDTGIALWHPEFEGRARWGYTVPINSTDQDIQGHGTHVAASVGGRTFGVAKSVSLVAVKVFDGRSGPVSNVIKGLAWALHDISSNGLVGLINLSITIPKSDSISSVARVAARKGILIVAAAGNTAQDACFQTLHKEPAVLSVGAFCYDFSLAPFSNHGPCVDLFAPGCDILSASAFNENEVVSMDGTSMATPNVAGVAALMLAQYGPMRGDRLKSLLLESSLHGYVRNLNDTYSENRILSSYSLLMSV